MGVDGEVVVALGADMEFLFDRLLIDGGAALGVPTLDPKRQRIVVVISRHPAISCVNGIQ
jgi:hypothetical protein